jgi:peptidoglycan hydrolase-like protein with peptidoglycan-binding domain
MSRQSTIKKTLLAITLCTSFTTPFSYADVVVDSSSQNLVAGFGTKAIANNLMNKAPTGSEITIPTNIAQATYLLSPNSPLVGPLTQQLLSQLANLGKDPANDKLSFTWNPNAKSDPNLEKDPIKSVDINSLLQPMTYTDVEKNQAKNVIDALSGTLVPLDTVNFNQLVANLSGDKAKNLKAKLNEKQTQTYLAALRSYLAIQTVALGNLYQLYAERQAIDPKTLSPSLQEALNAITNHTKKPVSSLQLENFMATRRILDRNWYTGLLTDNPATLQRDQVELLAENLAESHQTRMTLERLLATMSVLVLEINQQMRTQLQNQIQNINNPPKS